MADVPDDAIVAHVAAWIEADAGRDQMVREWQGLETRLMAKCRKLGLDFTYGHRSGMAEARAMRDLNRKIRAADRKLEIAAGRISGMRTFALEGAVAKIRLGLRIQGKYDWRPHALELLEGGVAASSDRAEQGG